MERMRDERKERGDVHVRHGIHEISFGGLTERGLAEARGALSVVLAMCHPSRGSWPALRVASGATTSREALAAPGPIGPGQTVGPLVRAGGRAVRESQ